MTTSLLGKQALLSAAKASQLSEKLTSAITMADDLTMTTLFPDPNHRLFMKETLSILIFYYGWLNENLIKEALEPFVTPNQSIDDVQKWATNYVEQARKHTIKYFIETMPYLVEKPVPPEMWQLLPEHQHRKIVLHEFNKQPSAICARAFAYENETVDFGAIFVGENPDMLPWRRMARIKFVELALATYDTVRYNDDMQELEAFWGEVSWCQEIRDLDLGGVGAVPTRNAPAAIEKSK